MKKSVKFNMEPEPATCESSGRTVKELEEALEAAYRERNEIIKTCKNEVEFHRTIASELENSIMEVGSIANHQFSSFHLIFTGL